MARGQEIMELPRQSPSDGSNIAELYSNNQLQQGDSLVFFDSSVKLRTVDLERTVIARQIQEGLLQPQNEEQTRLAQELEPGDVYASQRYPQPEGSGEVILRGDNRSFWHTREPLTLEAALILQQRGCMVDTMTLGEIEMVRGINRYFGTEVTMIVGQAPFLTRRGVQTYPVVILPVPQQES